jgi:hypothetical protein
MMPEDATLTKTEKNRLLPLIEKCGFDPGVFEWKEVVSEEQVSVSSTTFRISQLFHRSTGYYFNFGGCNDKWSPGVDRKVAEWPHDTDWKIRINSFEHWLKRLREEVGAPDLWAVVLQDRDFMRLTAVMDAGNTMFTEPEQRYISARLDEIRDFILAAAQLDDAQRQLVEAQTEYTNAATKRLGRIDWKNIFIAAFIGLVPNLVSNGLFAPDRARELVHLAVEAFTPLFQGLPGLNP